jgi:hypothetical protein
MRGERRDKKLSEKTPLHQYVYSSDAHFIKFYRHHAVLSKMSRKSPAIRGFLFKSAAFA